jgi:hypothetical protein
MLERTAAGGAAAEDALIAHTVGSCAASLPQLGADLTLPLAALRAKALGLAGRSFGSLADRFASLVVRSDAGGDSSNNESGPNGGVGSPATDAAWAAMDRELADREAGGWEVTAAAMLLRVGVRDRPSLTEDADPRSQVLVELLRRLVLQREGARPDDPAVLNGGMPAPSAASVAADAAAGGAAAAVSMSYPVQRSLGKNNNADVGKNEAPAPEAKAGMAAPEPEAKVVVAAPVEAAKVVVAAPVEAAAGEGSATAGAAEVRAFLSRCGLERFAGALLAFGVDNEEDLCDPDIVTDAALLNSANGLGLKPAQLNKFRKAVALRAAAASAPSTVRAACEELRKAVGDGSDACCIVNIVNIVNIVQVQRFLS